MNFCQKIIVPYKILSGGWGGTEVGDNVQLYIFIARYTDMTNQIERLTDLVNPINQPDQHTQLTDPTNIPN